MPNLLDILRPPSLTHPPPENTLEQEIKVISQGSSTNDANRHVGCSFPTPGLIIRSIGKTRRRIACLLLALAAIIAMPPLWWSTQLIGLPDIGDPFDIASFRSSTVPDDRNAFVCYREAATLLKPLEEYVKAPRTSIQLFARWSKADADHRRLLTENREALAIYRDGSDRPDAFDPSPIVSSRDSDETFPAGPSFRRMVLLEASRLEDDEGDMAGGMAPVPCDGPNHSSCRHARLGPAAVQHPALVRTAP